MNTRSNRAALAVIVALGLGGTAAGQCIEGDNNGDGVVNGIDLAIVLGNWGNTCPAEIESVWPPSGALAGGTEITITGQQLGGAQSVTIGGVPATDVVIVDAGTITAVTPPSKAAGARDVEIITTTGAATLPAGFIYSPLTWATALRFTPDPLIVTDAAIRNAIVSLGLPWLVQDDATGIVMTLIPPGNFEMGCSASLEYGCSTNELPVHDVGITAAFYLARSETTQEEWVSVVGTNPSMFQDLPDHGVRPVERVSWVMIQEFNQLTSLRLPTEAEWEYAGRGGTATAFHNGSDDDFTIAQLAWFVGNSGGTTNVVAQKAPNSFGLYDVHGNVSEWINDFYDANFYEEASVNDPTGPLQGDEHVFRGGSYSDISGTCRVSRRFGLPPTYRASNVGFRVARDATP